VSHRESGIYVRILIAFVRGPSGSGKTSLLLGMAGRLRSSITTRYKVRGRMLFNGAEASSSVVESIISFVTQDDEGLLPSLTVRETLQFAASLRLPSWMTKAEKNKRAEQVLLKMGLKVRLKFHPRRELLEFDDTSRTVRIMLSAINL